MKNASAEDLEIVRQAMKLSLQYLSTEFLNCKPIWSSPVHDELAAFMARPSKRKLILIPRHHLKSTIVTKNWSIQQSLINPNTRILIANAVWEQSRKFLSSIEKMLTWGSQLPALFGRFDSENWNQFDATIRQRTMILDAPTFVTTGVDKEQTSQHYDIIVGDDLVGPQNVGTPEQRNKVFDYYLSLYDLLEPTGTLVIIGTRHHQDDLYSRILEEHDKMKNWDVFFRTCYKEDGSVLFPEKFSIAQLEEIRSKPGGKAHFWSQYMNNPISPETADFRENQVIFYDPATPHPSHLYLTVDPAISLSRDADYSAFVVAGQFSNRRIRVVDALHRRVVPSDLVDQIFELVKKYRLHRIGIETFAFQKTLKYEIQRQQRQRNIFFSIDELGKRNQGRGENVMSKEARIRRLQPYVEQGLLELDRRNHQDLLDELLAFPRGKHDDLIDALAWQLDYLVPSMDKAPKPIQEIHGSLDWWLNNHMPEPQKSIYDRFFQDVKR